jgi:uncharacterized OsmC-like protein
MKLIRTWIAMATFAAVFAVSSTALASPELTQPAGTTLPTGTFVEMKSTENLVWATATGNHVCATSTLTGELRNNSGTQVDVDITTAEFSGTPGVSPHTTHCSAAGGTSVTWTPNHTTNACHTPTGGTQHCSLPWCFNIKGGGEEFTIRGGKCSEAPRPLTFVLHSTLLGACSYQKVSLVGKYKGATLKIREQLLNKVTGSVLCPTAGPLEVTFALTTEDGAAVNVS